VPHLNSDYFGVLLRTLQTHIFNLKTVDSRLSLFVTPKVTYKTLNTKPNNGMNIITVVSVVVFVVMNIAIIKVRNKTPKFSTYLRLSPVQFSANAGYIISVSVLNAKRRKLPRGPALRE
jgi:hypothetical protein